MNKTVLPIKGMHCRSCEILIAEALKEVPGVRNVHIKYKDKEATIYHEKPVPYELFRQAVTRAGYEVGADDSKSWISSNFDEYWDFAVAMVLFLIVYFIIVKLGWFNVGTTGSGNPGSLTVVFLIGLTAGISTCMALVGGLILGITARHKEKHPEATPMQNFRPHLYFNIGRILSYTLLGGLIGLIGKAFQLSGTTLGIMTLIVGVIMLVLGIQLTGLFPKVSSGLTLPSGIARLIGIKKHHDKEYSHINAAVVGGLTFFLPCGFTQAMQLFAISTGSFVSGALIMGIFALGTAPGLLSIGGLTSVIKGGVSSKFFKFVAIALIVMSIFNLRNGLNLTGWKIPSGSGGNSGSTLEDPNVTLENGVQVVKMTQLSGGYSPNKFTIKKGIPVKWVIDSKDSRSCASSILLPKYNIKKLLKPGQNIIEFIPKDVGEVKFSCSMGMYTGKFIIVESPQAEITPIEKTAPSVAEAPKDSNVSKASAVAALEFKTTYVSLDKDISPTNFTIPANQPVKFSIDVKEDGVGCMSTIMIPGIIDEPEFLQSGQTINWEFTAKPGTYEITCAMGVPRGTITVV